MQKKDGIQDMDKNNDTYLSLNQIYKEIQKWEGYIDSDLIDRITIGFQKKGEHFGRRIIQCKDCLRSDKYCHCAFANIWTNENDFCSRAILKEGVD